jgi:excisionase family DNA binding protein
MKDDQTQIQTHLLQPDDAWLTMRQAAARAQAHEATLRRLIQVGLLRHARVGPGKKHIRIRASWLDEALIACATPPRVPAAKAKVMGRS